MPSLPATYRPPWLPTNHARKRAEERRRRVSQPWRNLYKTVRWQRIRSAQLAAEPLCERHKARGEVVAATVVNHVEPHRGDKVKFFAGPFESVCAPCHDGEIQAEERKARVRTQNQG